MAVPLYVDAFWLRLGMFAFAGAVAALGLGLLLGQAGQLSLGHSFFVAVGAYGYTFLAAEERTVGVSHQAGLALPPVVAVVLAVLLAGAAGLVFSPIAARLRGIYLGIASLGLVFVGQHVLFNVEALTGGFNGRNVPGFTLLGWRFDSIPGETLYVLGVPFGREEKLWYLGLTVTAVAYLSCRNLVRGRPGRALRAIRDRELMAGIMGVPVTRYKAHAFLISSMYAGLGGVLLALAFGRIVPETFGMALAVEYLAMVVIGGLASPAGAVAGAAFVSCLPAVLERYAAVLPGLAPAGAEGISPAVAAKFAFGAAIVALLLFEPGGAAAIGGRLRSRSGRALHRFRRR
ncbi:branched-chain amino acid transport system permease protein [Kribbella steppae]|uniref:Branched-chain amino acid transport system permease protein n=1 Tax=Kribbella steppae TaxID=2512223 RepID=A0A4R2HFQ6_9ACTN|nr:branched-chain amino acid ABC transporter permease [Kribbella steppae]TCO28071.1 branched-chain amino acid transport system permease protein [Kribbella steppae]